MATTRILLPVEYATLPSANPAVRSTITSAAAATTNCPIVTYQQLAFNDTTDQHAMWLMRLPADWLSGATIIIKFSAAAVTGNVVMKAGLCPATDSSTDIDTSSVYTAGDLSSTTAVGATSGHVKEISWALTTTNVAVGRWLSIFLGRDADNGADTAVGNVNVTAVEFEYTS